MECEEFGEISDEEVHCAVLSGSVIEVYPDDQPYPSCLIYGRTIENRPLHIVCALDNEELLSIVITAHEPHPEKWIEFSRRRQ